MAGQFFDFLPKGITRLLVKDKTTGSIFVLPAPSGGNFDPGIELAVVEESDCEGVTTTAKRYPTKRNAKLTLNMPKMPEVVSMRLGKGVSKRSTTDTEDKTLDHFTVPTSGIIPAVSSGFAGFGITANAVATGAFQNEAGFSETLVQDTNYGSFDEAAVGNEKKFAVGANGALKFGTATRGRRATVEIAYPTSAFYQLGSDLISLSIKVEGVNIYLQRLAWIYPDVSIEPGAVDLKEPTQELSFFVNGAYDIRWYQQFSLCRDKAA